MGKELDAHFDTPRSKERSAKVKKVKQECRDIFEITEFFSKQYGGKWEYDGKAIWWNHSHLRWIARVGEKYFYHNPKAKEGIKLVSWDDGLIKETTICEK